MNKENYMTVAEVAEELGADPQSIRDQARRNPSDLGFNICKIGSRIYVPREAYEKWKKGE